MNGVFALPPPLGERALAAVPSGYRSKVEAAGAISWLPFEVHMGVLRALRTNLGARGFQQLCRDQVSASLDHPMLFAKPAQAALRLYGAGPFAIFRAIPPSLNYIFRDAGQLRVSISESGYELDARYEDLPPRFAHDDTWELIWTATFEAVAAYVFEGIPTRAHVALTRQDASRGYYEWHMYLSPRE